MPLEMQEKLERRAMAQVPEMNGTSVVQQSSSRQGPGEELSQDGWIILHSYPSQLLEAKWLECLGHAIAPAHYASPAFFREPYFRDKNPFAVLAICQGAVVGVLTGLHEQGTVLSGLETRVHMALDERQSPEEVLLQLLRGIRHESGEAGLIQVYSWHHFSLGPFVQGGFRKREFIGNPVLDLSLGPETLLKQCNSKRRNCIRYAMKSGLEIKESTTREEFDEFYNIYEQWCAAKGVFQYSRELEWEAIETTKENRRLWLAKADGRIVAGSVFRFFPGGLVEYSRNSSLPEFQRLKPNDLLVWHAVEWACKHGFTHFSMGGHHRFLREFGGQMQGIDRYRMDRTLFRRHDRADFVRDTAQRGWNRLSTTQQDRIRRLLGREKSAGW